MRSRAPLTLDPHIARKRWGQIGRPVRGRYSPEPALALSSSPKAYATGSDFSARILHLDTVCNRAVAANGSTAEAPVAAPCIRNGGTSARWFRIEGAATSECRTRTNLRMLAEPSIC